MNDHTHTLRQLPIEVVEDPQPGDAWARCPLAQADDAQLLAAAVAAITPPKRAAPTSFVLHAPLELLARARLLRWVAPAARDGARRRIAEVAVRYAWAGDEVAAPVVAFTDADAALAVLTTALREGDSEAVDAALCFLLPRVPLARLRAALVDEVAPRLGAAAHVPILLAALPGPAGRIAGIGGLLRAPLRALAMSAPGQRLGWHRTAPATAVAGDPSRALAEALVAPPRLPASSSIAPTVLAAERSGDATRLLAGSARALAPAAAARTLQRVAALSMLQDDPAHAAYGWTHCLTLPQALLANADASTDPQALVAVAATQVLAFRATWGRVALDLDAWPAPPTAPSTDVMTTLASRAALHADAHLAKYTLACFDAAASDPDAAPLFLAAAAHLGDWWAARASG